MTKRKSFGFKCINVIINILSAEAHLAEGQFLLKEQTLTIEVSNIQSRNSNTNSFQMTKAEFRYKINLNEKQYTNVIPALT
jgi:hypothetical protein